LVLQIFRLQGKYAGTMRRHHQQYFTGRRIDLEHGQFSGSQVFNVYAGIAIKVFYISQIFCCNRWSTGWANKVVQAINNSSAKI
jgi:hypothetical protein